MSTVENKSFMQARYENMIDAGSYAKSLLTPTNIALAGGAVATAAVQHYVTARMPFASVVVDATNKVATASLPLANRILAPIVMGGAAMGVTALFTSFFGKAEAASEAKPGTLQAMLEKMTPEEIAAANKKALEEAKKTDGTKTEAKAQEKTGFLGTVGRALYSVFVALPKTILTTLFHIVTLGFFMAKKDAKAAEAAPAPATTTDPKAVAK